MKKKDLAEILVFTFLNHPHKWVSINRLSKESNLSQGLISEFIDSNPDLILRAKTKNKKGEALFSLSELAKSHYRLEKINSENLFLETKKLLLAGEVSKGIQNFYQTLKNNENKIPSQLNEIYKQKLNILSSEYFQINELWKSDEITTKERFAEQDIFAFKLYESVLQIENILSEINHYKFKYKNVSIKIDADFSAFSSEDINLITNKISTLLEIDPSDFFIKSIEEGSVIMTLEFEDSTQAENLFLLIKMGKLKEDGVKDVRLKELSEKIKQQTTTENSISKTCRNAKIKIQNGQSEKALELLFDQVDQIPNQFHNEIYLLSADLKNVNQQANLSLESYENLRIARNRITFALLELIDRIKKEA